MSSDSGSVSVWPGYVAAVSCLVLSLLLLAAIVVSLITQLGSLAAAYNETLRQASLKRYQSPGEPSQPAQAEPSAVAAPVRAPMVLKRPGESAVALVESPRQGAQPSVRAVGELRLVFDPALADIPASQLKDLATALEQIDAPPGGRWQIWAAASDADVLASRTTFKLMLAVRSYMVKVGIPESSMDLRLVPLITPTDGARRGEIVIHVVPQRQPPAAQRSS